MKYKLPVPDDFPYIEEYSYKLSRAYSLIYVDFMSVLVTIENSLKALKSNDNLDREIAEKMLSDILKDHD